MSALDRFKRFNAIMAKADKSAAPAAPSAPKPPTTAQRLDAEIEKVGRANLPFQFEVKPIHTTCTACNIRQGEALGTETARIAPAEIGGKITRLCQWCFFKHVGYEKSCPRPAKVPPRVAPVKK